VGVGVAVGMLDKFKHPRTALIVTLIALFLGTLTGFGNF
jgi:hypothetical protein